MSNVKIPTELAEIAERVVASNTPQEVSIRTLLGWFGHSRRFPQVVSEIREALAAVALNTEPDFEYSYLEADVALVRSETAVPSPLATLATQSYVDPTFRVGRLPSANQALTFVRNEATLLEATTLMMSMDFSQIPIMQSERDVKGILTWQSIGWRMALGIQDDLVSCYKEADVQILTQDASLFEALEIIQRHGYVLVRDATRKITGIVTSSDINEQFKLLSEPFMLIGEIENYVRTLLSGKFSVAELRKAADKERSDTIERISDLTFGEYIQLLGMPDNWARVGIRMDRVSVIKALDEVRRIRNDVMHFDPDGLAGEDMVRLRATAKMFRSLWNVGVLKPASDAS